jgi:hypothetical protein
VGSNAGSSVLFNSLFVRFQVNTGSKVQRFKGSKVQRFKGSKVQRFKGSKVQRFKGSKVQRFFCFGICRSSFGFQKASQRRKGQNKRALVSVLTIGQH